MKNFKSFELNQLTEFLFQIVEIFNNKELKKKEN